MLQKILHFIKYNNATIIILAVILILGGGALAAGPENIGQKQTSVQGVDNTALLAADLENFSMDFKIENIQQDENYYYVTYSFLDLALSDSAWQYQLSQKTQKVSKKIKQDVGVYMAKFMAKHYEARIRELKQEKSLAQSQGEQKRVEVTEYSGLIGKTLDLAAAVFPGYEPVVKNELPTPEFAPTPNPSPASSPAGEGNNGTDNLTQIYNDYVAAHPEIFAAPPQAPADTALTPNPSPVPDVTGEGGSSTGETLPSVTETPTDSTGSPPAAADSAVPETSAISEPANVNVIDLPAPAPEAPVEPTPAPTPTTDSAPAQ